MALYRTERRLSWHHELRIGHWYAPWSQAQTDTGADYFSRTLRWLRHRYAKANISATSHALPATDAQWPKERFGLPAHVLPAGEGISEAPQNDAILYDDGISQNGDGPQAKQQTAHAGDLLLIEWPQPAATPSAQSATSQPPADAGAQSPLPSGELPPQWINGLERALRRNWQDNPLCEVVLVGGTAGIDAKGLALAAHYGLAVLDPTALLRPADNDAQDHRKALFCDGQADTPVTLTPQGQEIWAGMLIGLLRDRIRVGPTPDPVSLPEGLWCR